jgi:hypothetical protein
METGTSKTAKERGHADADRSATPTGFARLSDEQRAYLRFGAMIATSMVVMFVIMYLNTYELAHVEWSETRFFMTWVMGAAMAVVMLTFMLGMHPNKKVNAAIYLGSVAVFAGALWLVRSQATVGDTSYMRAMTPHHSIAILTSERADIDDVRVRELADEIIEAQRREIAEMEWLIADIEANGVASTDEEAAERPVPEFDGQP